MTKIWHLSIFLSNKCHLLQFLAQFNLKLIPFKIVSKFGHFGWLTRFAKIASQKLKKNFLGLFRRYFYVVSNAINFASTHNAYWLKIALKILIFSALKWASTFWDPNQDVLHKLLFPCLLSKYWKTSNLYFPSNNPEKATWQTVFRFWFWTRLISSFEKATIKIRTENAYKKFQKYSNFHNFWNISVFFVLFCFVYIQYDFIAHLKCQKHCCRLSELRKKTAIKMLRKKISRKNFFGQWDRFFCFQKVIPLLV